MTAAGSSADPTPSALATASEPLVRSLIGALTKRHTRGGVLGIQARLEWGGGSRDFSVDGRAVHVALCRSALSVRVALAGHDPSGWLVIVTDRTDDDLGLGITARLAGRRLRNADPWEPVQAGFGANRIDNRLVGHGRGGRDVALGLLLATPPGGWPPAPAGALTAGHAFGAVTGLLGMDGSGAAGSPVDATAILSWSARDDADRRIADLRARAGDPLVRAVLDWCADQAGPVGSAWRDLLGTGRAADLVPLGLVITAVVATLPGSGPRALLSRELGIAALPPDAVLAAWVGDAQDVVRTLLADDDAAAGRLLTRADAVLDHLDATAYVEVSDVLDRSLRQRWTALGRALHAAAAGADNRAATSGPDSALVPADRMMAVESAWSAAGRHLLAARRSVSDRAEAGVRLARWLAAPTAAWSSSVRRHREEDAWVDRAVATAWVGVGDEQLAQGLRTVLAAVRLRRDAHDRAFASALAGGSRPAADAVPIEDLLARHVLPLAADRDGGHTPVLLVVADGMSASNAVRITEELVHPHEGWLEYFAAGAGGPLSAVSALPSVTEFSRTSLLCGRITAGEQRTERHGFDDLCRAHGVTGRLFHKKPLDTSEGGYALSHDVAAAVDDTSGTALVACVLNTIDDALDRSDPGGTDWTSAAVKHLGPLLDRARRAGRVVVLTSDHGHVVERRDGHVAPGALSAGNRWRPISGLPPTDEEIEVSGPRVVTDGNAAILAVDERLRYSAMKAGYHGGASPAEVVIPVVLLAAGRPPSQWRDAVPQTPAWWRTVEPSPVEPAPKAPVVGAVPGAPTLFDDVDMPEPPVADLVRQVMGSATYRQQAGRAKHRQVADRQIEALLAACLAAPDGALDDEAASRTLGISVAQLAGATGQVQRLLNVEQYPVLSRDTERRTIVLDEALLREQFGSAR